VDKFQPFTSLHAAVLALIAIAAVVAVRTARRRAAQSVPTVTEQAIGVAFVLLWVIVHAWLMVPPRLDPAKTLPLQICHLTALASGLYLATRKRWLASLLYFWGFGLCTQALITPTLQEGPATPAFWYFWLSHGMIIGVAVYALSAHRYRPTWADWRAAALAAAGYAAVVTVLDLALGANYGFLGPAQPDQPTLVDWLGPWPARLVAIFALVAGVMALLMLPWALPKPRAARSSS